MNKYINFCHKAIHLKAYKHWEIFKIGKVHYYRVNTRKSRFSRTLVILPIRIYHSSGSKMRVYREKKSYVIFFKDQLTFALKRN